MATFRHPDSGVMLNLIVIRRKRLNAAEIGTARVLRLAGHTLHDIAAMLGINFGRVAEAIGKSKCPDPRQMTLF